MVRPSVVIIVIATTFSNSSTVVAVAFIVIGHRHRRHQPLSLLHDYRTTLHLSISKRIFLEGLRREMKTI